MNDTPTPAVQVSEAIRGRDFTLIARLYGEYPDIFAGNSALGPLLCIAALRSDPDTIKFLIGLGLDPNETKRTGSENALATAARMGRLDIVRLLHDNGAKLDTSEPTANPLISTVSSNAADVAQFLLDAGIDATVSYSGQNYKDMTAASFAVEQGALDVARTIVLHIAEGDREKAQQLLLQAYETAKRNNPDARSYPPPPTL